VICPALPWAWEWGAVSLVGQGPPSGLRRECNDLVYFFDILGGYDSVCTRVTARRIANR